MQIVLNPEETLVALSEYVQRRGVPIDMHISASYTAGRRGKGLTAILSIENTAKDVHPVADQVYAPDVAREKQRELAAAAIAKEVEPSPTEEVETVIPAPVEVAAPEPKPTPLTDTEVQISTGLSAIFSANN